MQGRKAIIDLYLDKVVHGPDVDATVLARGTTGMTGADLFNVINTAAVRAATLNKVGVSPGTARHGTRPRPRLRLSLSLPFAAPRRGVKQSKARSARRGSS